VPRFGMYLAAERFARGKGSPSARVPSCRSFDAQEFPTAALRVLDERYGFRKLRTSRTCCRGGRGWSLSLEIVNLRSHRARKPS
jgi:hypothetical protein